MKMTLLCTDYSVDRRAGRPPIVDVRFVVKTEGFEERVQQVAEALKRLELYLAGGVNLVKDDGSTRCFYCGTKQADDAQTCTQCGAPL